MIKKILPISLILIMAVFLVSCSMQQGNLKLNYIQNSKIAPTSRILVLPFAVQNEDLSQSLTQDFIYYLIKRNAFNIKYSSKLVAITSDNIKPLNKDYDYVIYTKVLRYDIKNFRPIFSIDMTIYNTFDASIAWKLRYSFYWNDPQTERFIQDSFGDNYNFNDFYDSKSSIRKFADIILEAISYSIAKIK